MLTQRGRAHHQATHGVRAAISCTPSHGSTKEDPSAALCTEPFGQKYQLPCASLATSSADYVLHRPVSLRFVTATIEPP